MGIMMSNRRPPGLKALIVTSIVTSIFVIASPILLAVVVAYDPRPITWVDLANVGQAYGGAAALISALALAGIAGSLLLQFRQTHLAQAISIRERHFELVKLGIERPELLHAVGAKADHTEGLIIAYANLWVGHWFTHWDLDIMDEIHLKHILKGFFRNEIIRLWWTEHGANWSTLDTQRRKRFIEILTEECARAACDDLLTKAESQTHQA